MAALVGFARALRSAGVRVGTDQALTYCRAAALLDIGDPGDLYWAGRTCLLSRHEDVDAYDRLFHRWFGGRGDGLALTVSGWPPPSPTARLEAARVRRPAPPEERDQEEDSAGGRASAAELLRHKRFPDCTPEELAALQTLMRRLRLDPPRRRTRRTRPAPRGGAHDLRRTIRRSLRTHGEPVHPAWRTRRDRPRRVVWLLDISGSMAGYSRALLQLAHSATWSPGATTEVFCFGTRLTRVTPQLRHRHPDRALAEAARAVLDWEGGTRIGDAVAAFLRGWGRSGMARGAIVVICSDGLDRGDPDLLAAEMARLARLAHRVVWVNPLKGDAGYEPTARGMHAALPSVDVLVSGHDLSSLEGLADLLPRLH